VVAELNAIARNVVRLNVQVNADTVTSRDTKENAELVADARNVNQLDVQNIAHMDTRRNTTENAAHTVNARDATKLNVHENVNTDTTKNSKRDVASSVDADSANLPSVRNDASTVTRREAETVVESAVNVNLVERLLAQYANVEDLSRNTTRDAEYLVNARDARPTLVHGNASSTDAERFTTEDVLSNVYHLDAQESIAHVPVVADVNL